MPSRIPWLARVLFAAALVFTLIGVIEMGFMIYDAATGRVSALQPDLGVGVRSWTVHHAMRPGYSSPSVHTNSFGLRSPEVAVPKPAGTFRILLLGDSFTYGLNASDDQVFARRLEERLRHTRGTEVVEVVNAGVLSYCPLLEYLQYRHHLQGLEPDLVILNFDMSDVQDHMDYSRHTIWSSDGMPLYVTQETLGRAQRAFPELLSARWALWRWNGLSRRIESKVEGMPFTRDLDRYLWALDNGAPWDREARDAMQPIAHLAAMLRHQRIPLALATYPQPWQVSAEATPRGPIRAQYGIGANTVHLNDRPFKLLDAFAAEIGIPFVNAAETFRAAPDPAGLFLTADFHFSPRGHQVYADFLGDFILTHPAMTSPE